MGDKLKVYVEKTIHEPHYQGVGWVADYGLQPPEHGYLVMLNPYGLVETKLGFSGTWYFEGEHRTAILPDTLMIDKLRDYFEGRGMTNRVHSYAFLNPHADKWRQLLKNLDWVEVIE